MLFQSSEVSDKELRFGAWFLVNKSKLLKIGYGLLIGLDVILISYVLFGTYQTVTYLFLDYNRLILQMQAVQPDFKQIAVKQAQPLQIIENQLIAGKDNKYDFLAKIRNPNSDWSVSSVTYRFNSGNVQTEYKESFFLPNEEKYLMVLGFFSESQISMAEIEIQNVTFSRVRNYETLKNERLNFVISDAKFISAKEINLSDKLAVSQISFNIANETFKSFWDVPLQVFLKRGTKIVGVNYISISNLDSFEKRVVTLDWYEDTTGISKVEVFPDVNILDESVFKNVKAPIGEIK